MSNKDPHTDFTGQNISFYNEIAAQYDEILDKDSNRQVRLKVAAKFNEVVRYGKVLDFGGGTGLDLPWLTKNFDIFFCEPSGGMREKAIQFNQQVLKSHRVIFLGQQKTDFTKWPSDLPFPDRLDGILSNFAVFNNISDLPKLFKTLAMLLRPKGHVIASVLDNRWMTLLKQSPLGFIKSKFSGLPMTMNVRYKDHQQKVYIHSENEIRDAAADYFYIASYEPIPGSSFILIDLEGR